MDLNIKENSNKSKLAPLYFIGSFEPFLLQEMGDSIRKELKAHGFIDHHLWQVDTHFDWNQLLTRLPSLGLFESKPLIELRLSQPPSETGAQVLNTYISQQSQRSTLFSKPLDQSVLILCEKPTMSLQKSSWFQRLSQIGKVIICSLPRKQWSFWIKDRVNSAGLVLTQEALHCLTLWTEGNPSVAAQTIEKLRLIYPKEEINNTSHSIQKQQIIEILEDQPHFELFSLTEAIFKGEQSRCLHILKHLKNQQSEPSLVLWIILRDLRILASLVYEKENGQTNPNKFQKHSIPKNQSLLFQKALKAYTIKDLPECFSLANQVDRIIKGAAPGNSWVALQNLSLKLSRSSGIS